MSPDGKNVYVASYLDEGLPEPMRAEWGNDEGTSAATRHRADLVPIREEFLGKKSCASTLVAVAALAVPEWLIEVEAIDLKYAAKGYDPAAVEEDRNTQIPIDRLLDEHAQPARNRSFLTLAMMPCGFI